MRQRLCAIAALMALFASSAEAVARPSYHVDRVVMLIRHGVRAPLDGEGPTGLARQPFATWSTPPSFLTPHGAAALRLLAAYDRRRLMAQGLLPRHGCPENGALAIWANTTERTIASGHALADGLAPGCDIAVGHLAEGQMDPLFDAIESGQVPVDGRAAAASIKRELDGGRALMRGEAPALATMARILGCNTLPEPCRLDRVPNRIDSAADGKGIRLDGPIATLSGMAQIFLLQYEEGMRMSAVGWGRATAADIARVSTLHARLFDVHARSRAMAPLVAGLLLRRIAEQIERPERARVSLFVGHDNNIAAVTALLGANFRVPGFGRNDPPPGGGLIFERMRNNHTGKLYVRLLYLAQTPGQVRRLTVLDKGTQPALRVVLLRGSRAMIPLRELRRAGNKAAGQAMATNAPSAARDEIPRHLGMARRLFDNTAISR